MCIIIDTNALASVFQSNSADHNQFKHVLDWIMNGKGKIVFGGTKYKRELNERYISLFEEFKKANKSIHIDDVLVDKEEEIVSKLLSDKDFDDQHLVGLLRISKCRLICSNDKRAYKYFKHNKFFPHAKNRPRIYSNSKNKNLLSDKYISSICCIKNMSPNKRP